MKKLKCSLCKKEKEVEDNIIISICNSCQVEMQEVKNENK